MTEEQEPIAASDIETLDDVYILGETEQEITLSTSADHILITDHMAPQATRSIRIFTRDLDPAIFDRMEFVSACKNLALRSRYARIEILAFNSQRIIKRGHRLVDMVRAMSSRMEIRRPGKEFEKHVHSFVTFDEVGYIYRTYADRYEGIANYNRPREAREFEKLFSEMWLRSHVDTEMKSLNI